MNASTSRAVALSFAALVFVAAGGTIGYRLGMPRTRSAATDGRAGPSRTEPSLTPAPLHFVPPADSAIPSGPFGEMVRRGRAIFVNTRDSARAYVGNSLSCRNCHLDAGRLANSAPMWAAWVAYPKFRSKNAKVNTMTDRIGGCFTYSMNGKAPPPDGDIMRALQSYFYWLATGAPTGRTLAGAGYPKPATSAQRPDSARGATVYSAKCAFCHGPDGAGQRSADGATTFPPVWGPRSYNAGAGMHAVGTAAGFIKANMPLGRGNTLNDQEAWDVAAYVNSHRRPADPRAQQIAP